MARLYLGITLGRVYNDLGLAETACQQLTVSLTSPANNLNPRVAYLGELGRAQATSGRLAEAAAAAREILGWTDQARYLFPNIGMALLFICRLPAVFGRTEMVHTARSAWAQLERLDGQYHTPITSACRLEGLGWIMLAEGDAAQAAASFRQAQTRWQELGHSYDQVRALNGLSRALTLAKDHEGNQTVIEQAMELVNSLSAQLEDPALKTSFLASMLA